MQRIVLTGGPGAGKTTTLDVLRGQGYATGDDAARSIIQMRKRAGLSPRPDGPTFAQQIFEREVEAYNAADSSPSFFERGMVEAVGSLIQTGALDESEVRRLLQDYRYQAVFVFPPWEEIYCTDDERDHTYSHSVDVYESVIRLYRRHGYEPIEVPRSTASSRAKFILLQAKVLDQID